MRDTFLWRLCQKECAWIDCDTKYEWISNMKLIFENWRKHITEDDETSAYADDTLAAETTPGYIPVRRQKELVKLVGGFGITEYEKVFEDHEDDKKRANIKLIGEWPKYVITYNSPDGKYIELPAGNDDDAFLAAINRWDDYLRAKVDKTIGDKYGSEEEPGPRYEGTSKKQKAHDAREVDKKAWRKKADAIAKDLGWPNRARWDDEKQTYYIQNNDTQERGQDVPAPK